MTATIAADREHQSLRLWLRLLSSSHLIEQHLRARLRARFNITLPQFDVLSELERMREPQTMSELSRQLLVSNGNLTGVVDRLEREALVRRIPARHDRRILYIELTAEGRRRFNEIAVVHRRWVSDLFAELPLDDLDRLTEQLIQFKSIVKTATQASVS